jgi:hypothetical protein
MPRAGHRQNPSEDAAVQVAKVNAKQAVAVALIAALSGIVGAALQAKLGSSASSQSKLEATSSSEHEKKALYKFMTDYLESEVGLTSAKGGTENPDDEIRYKRLFQAGFLTTGVMQADAGIWETTLNNLANRGYPWVTEYVPRLKAEYPKIKQLKLRWLEDKAIPQLQHEIETRPIGVQSLPSAPVTLPKEVWILQNQSNPPPAVPVSDMVSLKEEVELLKSNL